MGKRMPFRPNGGSIADHVANIVDDEQRADLRSIPSDIERPGPQGGPTTVYYLHTADHELLYVGISSSRLGLTRFQSHKDDKDWWTQVAYASMEHFDTRDEALEREAYAIHKLQPLHNKRRPAPLAQNKYGVRLCACGCRAPAPPNGRTNHRCISRRHMERKAAEDN